MDSHVTIKKIKFCNFKRRKNNIENYTQTISHSSSSSSSKILVFFFFVFFFLSLFLESQNRRRKNSSSLSSSSSSSSSFFFVVVYVVVSFCTRSFLIRSRVESFLRSLFFAKRVLFSKTPLKRRRTKENPHLKVLSRQ